MVKINIKIKRDKHLETDGVYLTGTSLYRLRFPRDQITTSQAGLFSTRDHYTDTSSFLHVGSSRTIRAAFFGIQSARPTADLTAAYHIGAKATPLAVASWGYEIVGLDAGLVVSGDRAQDQPMCRRAGQAKHVTSARIGRQKSVCRYHVRCWWLKLRGRGNALSWTKLDATRLV
jgi:hypothetical protein